MDLQQSGACRLLWRSDGTVAAVSSHNGQSRVSCVSTTNIQVQYLPFSVAASMQRLFRQAKTHHTVSLKADESKDVIGLQRSPQIRHCGILRLDGTISAATWSPAGHQPSLLVVTDNKALHACAPPSGAALSVSKSWERTLISTCLSNIGNIMQLQLACVCDAHNLFFIDLQSTLLMLQYG